MFGSDVSLQGEISIMNCSAGAGGAIYSKGSVVIENATVYLQDTVATKHGGGAIYAGNVKHKNGKLHVKSSWSKKKMVEQLRRVISTRPDLLASLPVLQRRVVPCLS